MIRRSRTRLVRRDSKLLCAKDFVAEVLRHLPECRTRLIRRPAGRTPPSFVARGRRRPLSWTFCRRRDGSKSFAQRLEFRLEHRSSNTVKDRFERKFRRRLDEQSTSNASGS